MIERRRFLFGFGFAPAVIVTPGLLMPVKPWIDAKPSIMQDDPSMMQDNRPWWAEGLKVNKLSGDAYQFSPVVGDTLTVEPGAGVRGLLSIKRGEVVDFGHFEMVYDCFEAGIWTPRSGLEFSLPTKDCI